MLRSVRATPSNLKQSGGFTHCQRMILVSFRRLPKVSECRRQRQYRLGRIFHLGCLFKGCDQSREKQNFNDGPEAPETSASINRMLRHR